MRHSEVQVFASESDHVAIFEHFDRGAFCRIMAPSILYYKEKRHEPETDE